jgi:hypothetical protein
MHKTNRSLNDLPMTASHDAPCALWRRYCRSRIADSQGGNANGANDAVNNTIRERLLASRDNRLSARAPAGSGWASWPRRALTATPPFFRYVTRRTTNDAILGFQKVQ